MNLSDICGNSGSGSVESVLKVTESYSLDSYFLFKIFDRYVRKFGSNNSIGLMTVNASNDNISEVIIPPFGYSNILKVSRLIGEVSNDRFATAYNNQIYVWSISGNTITLQAIANVDFYTMIEPLYFDANGYVTKFICFDDSDNNIKIYSIDSSGNVVLLDSLADTTSNVYGLKYYQNDYVIATNSSAYPYKIISTTSNNIQLNDSSIYNIDYYYGDYYFEKRYMSSTRYIMIYYKNASNLLNRVFASVGHITGGNSDTIPEIIFFNNMMTYIYNPETQKFTIFEFDNSTNSFSLSEYGTNHYIQNVQQGIVNSCLNENPLDVNRYVFKLFSDATKDIYMNCYRNNITFYEFHK